METIERQSEHFKETLNRKDPESPISDEETEATEVEEINTEEPTVDEIKKKTIKHLRNGKSAGIDSITAEMLKAVIDFSTEKNQITY